MDNEIQYGADPRQAEKFVYEMGLEGAKSVVTPGLRLSQEQVENDKDLAPDKTTMFRATAARGNYLSADRIDINFAAKEEIIPELLQAKCNRDNIFKTVSSYLDEPGKIKSQVEKTQLILNKFKSKIPSADQASDVLKKYLKA